MKLIFTIFLLFGLTCYGQSSQDTLQREQNTLEYFNYVLAKKSYKYRSNMVVPIVFLDTIALKIDDNLRTIKTLQSKYDSLGQERDALLDTVSNLKAQGAYLFIAGTKVRKQVYVFTSFAVVFLLLLFVVLLLFKNKEKVNMAQRASDNALQFQKEYQLLQKKSLEEKEVLARKLQDEILKHRK